MAAGAASTPSRRIRLVGVALVTLVIPVRGSLGIVVPLLDALEPQAKEADTSIRVRNFILSTAFEHARWAGIRE